MKNKLKIAILLDVSRAYDRALLTGLTGYNKIHDRFVFFSYSPKYIHTGDDADALIQRVIAWRPDGIFAREVVNLQALLELGIPLIVAPHTSLYPAQINVWGDGMAMGREVAEYFISRGHKRFAFLGFKHFQWSLERQRGFTGRVGEAGASVETFIFDNTNLLWEHLPEKLAVWLNTLKRPCAVFSATDELSLLLLEAARETGAKVPDDFSIIGADNDTMICETASLTLSSVDQHVAPAGFDAAAALAGWIERGDRPAGNIMVNSYSIVTRNSTNTLAVDDEQVRTALHYITTTAPSEDIAVKDVVNATSLSRRILEKRFQVMLKSSILDEIKKVRIARIKFLLEQSELTVQQIAYELNFRNDGNITRYFRQSTGLSPLEYRSRSKQATRQTRG